MRLRDQELYHLRKKGYERVATVDDLEVWAKPGERWAFRVIRACDPLPDEVRDALIEEFELLELTP